MEVEILHVPDCPSVDLLRARLGQAFGNVDMTREVRLTEVATAEQADRLGLHGSPTLLIDGRDPFAGPETHTSLSCRFFEVSGAIERAPSVEQLVAALQAPAGHAPPTTMPGVVDDLLGGGLSAVGQQLAVAGFDAIWRGTPLLPAQLLPSSPDEARDLAARIADQGRAELDHQARLVGIHGLTLRSTRHRFVHRNVTHSTWCAFDAIGIPAALRVDAVALTDCPACGRSIRVEMRDGSPPPGQDLVLWLPTMDPGDDLRATFCANADLYCSADHLDEVVDRSTVSGEAVDLGAAVARGRQTWRDVASGERD